MYYVQATGITKDETNVPKRMIKQSFKAVKYDDDELNFCNNTLALSLLGACRYAQTIKLIILFKCLQF